ncbi:hypothetical protein MJO28_011866 [Puccinia striiformis f. sp. tritici]|uniref:Uncharacterized protein n=1 Tax=Puccinia striiformis f. sp. tritici TaxID=168172 RepID=A0ACC0E3G4_9BASI|nr:hypothetical protein MJO28_011866 [Puccinia striiformis f. sp. tritici]
MRSYTIILAVAFALLQNAIAFPGSNQKTTPTLLERAGPVVCCNLCHTDLDSHTSKRSACHLMNDIIHTSNFIDRRSKPNSAPPSELLLDNHPSRTNDENRVPSQNSFPKSLSKRITKSNLIDRIALPSRDFNLAV